MPIESRSGNSPDEGSKKHTIRRRFAKLGEMTFYSVAVAVPLLLVLSQMSPYMKEATLGYTAFGGVVLGAAEVFDRRKRRIQEESGKK